MGKLFSNAQYFAVREGLKGKSQEEMGRTQQRKVWEAAIWTP